MIRKKIFHAVPSTQKQRRGGGRGVLLFFVEMCKNFLSKLYCSAPEYSGLPEINKPKSIAPLVTFRVLFGALMLFGALRFMYSDWIERLYLTPKFFFKYYGFEWITPLSEIGIYALFIIIAVSAFCIMIGLFYRIATVIFFLTFSYSELIDATNYLNHYYLVALLAFLLIFIPAHRAFSVDVLLFPRIRAREVPAWTVNILIFQLTIVYIFAGIAKLNYDWIFRAMPLAIWLPERANTPILGYFFQMEWVAYAFCWFGAFYDLTIAYFLMYRPTRRFAYLAVVVFHVLTKLLFNIGLFPIIMMTSTLIFFSGDVHERFWKRITGYDFKNKTESKDIPEARPSVFRILGRIKVAITSRFSQSEGRFRFPLLKIGLTIYIVIQILLPFHHFLYKGNVLWTEEGYRLSWRVMVLEKSGNAIFKIKDSATNRKSEITNSDYLTLFQEKQMAIQPDFIVQYAHFLKKEYEKKHGFVKPIITAEVHVAMNGRPSKRLIDNTVNLAEVPFNLKKRGWVIDY